MGAEKPEVQHGLPATHEGASQGKNADPAQQPGVRFTQLRAYLGLALPTRRNQPADRLENNAVPPAPEQS